MQPNDIARLTEVSDPQVSLDSKIVAIVVTTVDLEANAYCKRIWAVATGGSAAPRPLTGGRHRDTTPRWSPDGTRMAFVSHREGEGKGSQLVHFPGEGHELSRSGAPRHRIERAELILDWFGRKL